MRKVNGSDVALSRADESLYEAKKHRTKNVSKTQE